MKHVLLISFVLLLSIDSLLAQKEQNSGSGISFRNSLDPAQPPPLFVIDGFVYDSLQVTASGTVSVNKNEITSINPDDIDSMNILKNETAVYLYGDKAKYGVIIITTKKGRNKSDKIQKE
jgi:iron complex outermembrane receptor protein